MMNSMLIAAFQGHINEQDSSVNLNKMIQITKQAEKDGIDLLLFPEVYLHGYYPNKNDAIKSAIDLNGIQFKDICKEFEEFQNDTTVLFGLNEIDGDHIYNTVVVIEKGHCIGKYRKAYTYAPYDYYSLGREFPIFEKKDIKYGIIICYDSLYREPAHIVALKGAKIIFCPMFNRVQRNSKMLPFMNNKNHFIARAFDNNCWFVASDIVCEGENEVCSGYSCILNDHGELIANGEPYQEMLVSYSIPIEGLKQKKKARLMGNAELFEIVKSTYAESL